MASKTKSQPLTGQALKDKVREMQGTDKKDMAKACGYTSKTKNGQERINLMSFYGALLDAEGVEFEAAPETDGRGRKATYKASVHTNGNLLIGAVYTKEMGLQPGDEFTLKLSKRRIALTRVD